MSLHIIIGYDGPTASANPSLVYLGRSGVDARAAMTESCAVRFEVLQNPIGYRKHNPLAAANAAHAKAPKKSRKPKAGETVTSDSAGPAVVLTFTGSTPPAAQAPAVIDPPVAPPPAAPPAADEADDDGGENHFAQ